MWLLKCHHAHCQDGTLQKEIILFNLQQGAVHDELILLATAAASVECPALCQEHTPVLYDAMKSMLFVGFVHNLMLESDVSKMVSFKHMHWVCKHCRSHVSYVLLANVHVGKYQTDSSRNWCGLD